MPQNLSCAWLCVGRGSAQGLQRQPGARSRLAIQPQRQPGRGCGLCECSCSGWRAAASCSCSACRWSAHSCLRHVRLCSVCSHSQTVAQVLLWLLVPHCSALQEVHDSAR